MIPSALPPGFQRRSSMPDFDLNPSADRPARSEIDSPRECRRSDPHFWLGLKTFVGRAQPDPTTPSAPSCILQERQAETFQSMPSVQCAVAGALAISKLLSALRSGVIWGTWATGYRRHALRRLITAQGVDGHRGLGAAMRHRRIHASLLQSRPEADLLGGIEFAKQKTADAPISKTQPKPNGYNQACAKKRSHRKHLTCLDVAG